MNADAVEPGVLARATPVLEDLDLAEAALDSLCEHCGGEPGTFALGQGWAARVEVDGTLLLLHSGDGARWSILAPPGTDEADAASAARKLHGLLGAQSEGWDLDR